MSVKLLRALAVEKSARDGVQPHNFAGLHLKPASGAAEINSPHQQPSAGR
jgi:hypothetical protein